MDGHSFKWLLPCCLRFPLAEPPPAAIHIFIIRKKEKRKDVLVERTRQTCKRGRGLHLLSVLMVELLVKCSFAAEAETIGLWDVFVDPHFSFRIHSSPAERAVPARGSIFPLRKQSPMRPFDRTAGQISQDTFPSPLFQTSKCPRDIFCIYNMNVCVSFISWVKRFSGRASIRRLLLPHHILLESFLTFIWTILKVKPWEMDSLGLCQEIRKRIDTTLKVPHQAKSTSPTFPCNIIHL